MVTQVTSLPVNACPFASQHAKSLAPISQVERAPKLFDEQLQCSDFYGTPFDRSVFSIFYTSPLVPARSSLSSDSTLNAA
jgi:hypothetical protein